MRERISFIARTRRHSVEGNHYLGYLDGAHVLDVYYCPGIQPGRPWSMMPAWSGEEVWCESEDDFQATGIALLKKVGYLR